MLFYYDNTLIKIKIVLLQAGLQYLERNELFTNVTSKNY